ncbi:MAG: SDR family oxidoreductase [Thalassobaculales bacterium]
MRLYCFGPGYSARALGRLLSARGWQVAGSSRADFAEPGAALDEATHILVSVPPDEEGDPTLRLHADRLRRLRPAWVGYLSTTGVYGDHGGGWVDEETPLNPVNARGRRRVEAEAAWLDTGLPVELFRLSAIYGPGRSAIDQMLAGTARRIVKPGQVFNRIHVEDIAAVLAAAIDRPAPGAVYNLADDEPAPPQDVVAYAAHLLGRAPPPELPFPAAGLSVMAASFYAENKRVRNARIKALLGRGLRYPTYREGLYAIAATAVRNSARSAAEDSL